MIKKDAIAIIPARGGSKRIPKKNIKEFFGKPLIAYSIEAALDSNLFEKVVVTTDDKTIAKVAKQYGADVPFLRPKELSDDFTGTVDVVNHAVEYLESQGETYEYICTIYATAPFLQSKYLKEGYEKLKNSNAVNALSATSMPFPIQRTFKLDENGRCKMFTPEHYMSRSQDLEEAYQDAGQFYWTNRTRQKESKNQVVFSDISIPIILPRHLVQDIDTLEDWTRAEYMYQALKNSAIEAVKYLGYDIKIDYGDYERYEVVIDDLKELDNICDTLETDDEYFNITYREKHQYKNKYLYSKKEHMQIKNKNISNKYKLIEDIHFKIEDIYNSENIDKNDIIDCIEDLQKLLDEIPGD